jgi:glutathione S-transferase
MKHYGWLVSPFSAKTRGYLRYSGLPFTDVEPNLVRYMTTIRTAVGRPIMPTVQLADGRWLQDSSDIIDHVERTQDVPSVIPPGPSQRVASALVELLADEWLPMAAIHFRWNTTENAVFAIDDFARSGLPFLPRAVGRPIMRRVSRRFQNYRSVLRTVVDAIDTFCDAHPGAKRVPRSLGVADFEVRGRRGKRNIGTFTQYKIQRVTTELPNGLQTPWLDRFAARVPTVTHPFTRTADFKTILTPA